MAETGYELVAESLELAQRLDQQPAWDPSQRFDGASLAVAAERSRSHLDGIVAESEDLLAATAALVDGDAELAAEARARAAAAASAWAD